MMGIVAIKIHTLGQYLMVPMTQTQKWIIALMAQVFVLFFSQIHLIFHFWKQKNSIVPFPPTNLQLTQKSSTSVTISWTASAGSGVYYKVITSTTTTKYSSTSTTWNSLSPSTTYTFYIYAGKNNPSNSAETYETVGMFIFFLSFFFFLTLCICI